MKNLFERPSASGCSWKRCWLERQGKNAEQLVECERKDNNVADHVEPSTEAFVMEACFLRELLAVLTTDANEHMRFLTGPKIDQARVVCRWAQPSVLERQSPVFVRASAQSVAAALIPMIEQGAELHIIAHSHPGSGPGGTNPSSTDIECLGELQRSGSRAIGCIFSRDGWVRFFTVSTKFSVQILGTGTATLNPQIFYVGHHADY